MKKFITNVKFPFLKNGRAISLSLKGKDKCFSSPQQMCKPEYGPSDLYRTDFLSGMKMACMKPAGAPIASVTIMYQAGSQYEFDDFLGVTHFLRVASMCTGLSSSKFMRSRYLQQHGAYITTTGDRQCIAYTLRCQPPLFCDLMFYLIDSNIRCCYPDYEMDGVREMIRTDLDRRNPEQHCLDLVQKACFAGRLSNSVYCKRARIDSITGKHLTDFKNCFFKPNHCTIASYGVDFEEMLSMAAVMDSDRSGKKNEPYVGKWAFRGGCERHDVPNSGDIYIALALPGAGMADFEFCLQHAILAAACGMDVVHRGSHLPEFIAAEPLGSLMPGAHETEFKAFNISYMEAGCWGILIRTRKAFAREATFKAAEFLSNLKNISLCEINLGKQRLKTGVLINDSKVTRLTEGVALQIAAGQNWETSEQLGHMIDLVAADAVHRTATSLGHKRDQGLLAMGVVGDCSCVPYTEELC